MRRAILLLAVIGAAVLLATGVALAQQDRTTPDTQQQTAQENTEGVIPGQYIVVLKDDVPDPRRVAQEHARGYGAEVIHTYQSALKGYAARISDRQLDRLRADNRVLFIDEDREVSADAQETPTGIDRAEVDLSPTAKIDGNDERVGVGVAVIDTGVDLKHTDLNVKNGKTCVRGTRNANDDHGHGTHVAGTIGAKDDGNGVVGVAPGATLYAVKVLNKNGSGSRSDIICGIDWTTANAQSLGIKVANVSIGGSGSDDGKTCAATTDAYKKAFCNSVNDSKVTYAVSAGNSNVDFKDQVPAAYDMVLTVTAAADFNGQSGGGAAITCGSDDKEVDDTAANFSNYTASGSSDEGHTIAAPGKCIKSTWKGGGYNTISGTSMASPHAAGMAALYLANNSAEPAQVMAKLRDDAKARPTSYGFTDDPNSPNGTRYYGYLGYAGGY